MHDANSVFLMMIGAFGLAVVIAVVVLGAGVRWAWKRWVKKGGA